MHEVGGDTEQHSVEERSSTAGRGESLDGKYIHVQLT